MKQKPWKAYLWATLPTIAGGVLAGILSGSGGNYENYIKPPLSPPGWLFPVVWAVLYLLMAIGMAMVWNADQAHAKPARNLYIVQLVVNLLWPFFFFRWEMWGFAVIWLLLLIALVMVMALRFEQISPKAAYLQIPYLIWLCFAAYLNIAIWLLNRQNENPPKGGFFALWIRKAQWQYSQSGGSGKYYPSGGARPHRRKECYCGSRWTTGYCW